MGSRYTVEEHRNTFLVRGTPHPLDVPGQKDWLVDLAYEYSRLRRQPAKVVLRSLWLENETSGRRFGLLNFYDLLRDIARTLLRKWVSPATYEAEDPRQYQEFHMHEWAIKRATWAINRQVHVQWKRLLAQVDPTVLAVNKAVFAAAFGYGPGRLLIQEELYREQYIVQDILRYRAAAIAARGCSRLDWMAEWRSLYCPDGTRPYAFLNKTLDCLPGGVPPRLVWGLGRFLLPRPITSRLELIATSLAGQQLSQNFRAFAFSDAEQIAEAMRRVSRFLHRELRPRRWRDVAEVIQFLLDYPERHHGKVVGLAEKAIRWHRDCQREESQRVIQELGESRALARPSIPLPATEGVRFLATVGDLCAEAEAMGNCIASYAQRAVRGSCYLFHVEFQGEQATVEVSPAGVVIQSQGPGNRPNAAATWGQRVLARWGRQLRAALRPPISSRPQGNFPEELL